MHKSKSETHGISVTNLLIKVFILIFAPRASGYVTDYSTRAETMYIASINQMLDKKAW